MLSMNWRAKLKRDARQRSKNRRIAIVAGVIFCLLLPGFVVVHDVGVLIRIDARERRIAQLEQEHRQVLQHISAHTDALVVGLRAIDVSDDERAIRDYRKQELHRANWLQYQDMYTEQDDIARTIDLCRAQIRQLRNTYWVFN